VEYIPGILSNNALGESCLKQFYGNIYTWKILYTTMATEPQEFQFCDRRNIYSSGLFVCSCFYTQNVTLKESFQPVISKESLKPQFSAYMQNKKQLTLITIENTNKSK